MTDEDGIMQCHPRVNPKISQRVPPVFAFLIEHRMLEKDDLEYLKNLSIKERLGKGGKTEYWYGKGEFTRLHPMAKKYGIFALQGDLEHVLKISKTEGGKIRNALDAVEKVMQGEKKVPPLFREFLSYVRTRIKVT